MHVEQLSVAFVAVNADVNYPQRAGGIPKIVNFQYSDNGGDFATLYPVGTVRFQEPWKAMNAPPR